MGVCGSRSCMEVMNTPYKWVGKDISYLIMPAIIQQYIMAEGLLFCFLYLTCLHLHGVTYFVASTRNQEGRFARSPAPVRLQNWSTTPRKIQAAFSLPSEQLGITVFKTIIPNCFHLSKLHTRISSVCAETALKGTFPSEIQKFSQISKF